MKVWIDSTNKQIIDQTFKVSIKDVYITSLVSIPLKYIAKEKNKFKKFLSFSGMCKYIWTKEDHMVIIIPSDLVWMDDWYRFLSTKLEDPPTRLFFFLAVGYSFVYSIYSLYPSSIVSALLLCTMTFIGQFSHRIRHWWVRGYVHQDLYTQANLTCKTVSVFYRKSASKLSSTGTQQDSPISRERIVCHQTRSIWDTH